MAAFSIINDLEEFLKTWKGAKGYKPPPGQPMPFTGQVPPTATVPRPMAFKPQPAPQTPPTPQPRPVGPEAWKGAGPTVPALRSPQLVGPKLGPASGETPQSSARPFSQDYPGAKGRLGDPLTQDIEGRPLEAPAIAGRQTFGGRDVPLTAQQIHDLALKGLTELPILKDLGMRVGGQFLGSTPWASPLMRQIQINSRLSPEQRMRTFAHETAHMIDHMAGGHTGSLPIDLAEMERVYKDASEAGAGTTPGFRGYKGRKIYPEYIAEGLRAYLTNPGYFKTVAPKTAKMFRDAINTTPALRKIVQLNIIPLLAVGVGELAGGEAKAAEGDVREVNVKGLGVRQFPADMPDAEVEKAIKQELSRGPTSKEAGQEIYEAEQHAKEMGVPDIERKEPLPSGIGRVGQLLKGGAEKIVEGAKKPMTEADFAEGVHRHGQPVGIRIRPGASDIVGGIGDITSAPSGLISPMIERKTGIPMEVTETVLPMLTPFIKTPSLTKTASFLGKASAASKTQYFTKQLLREAGAWAHRETSKTAAQLEPFYKEVNKMGPAGNLAVMAHIEGISKGAAPLKSPKAQALADQLRIESRKRRTTLENMPATAQMHFVEDYFPHLWEDPQRAAKWAAGFMAKQGSGGFTKQRKYPTIADGLAAGLKLKNPDVIASMMEYTTNADKFIAHTQAMQIARDKGYVKFFRPGSKNIPLGHVELNGRMSQKITPAGPMKAYAPPEFAGIWNRFVDKGFHGSNQPYTVMGKSFSRGQAYDAIRRTVNGVTAMELSLSAFHGIVMMNEAYQSGIARGMREVVGGGKRLNPKLVLRGVGHIAEAPFKPVTTALKGHAQQQVFLGLSPGTAQQQEISELLMKAGGRAVGFQHDQSYEFSAMNSYWTSWRRGALRMELAASLAKAKTGVLPAGVETAKHIGRILTTISKPLFEHYIPKLKTGAFSEAMSSWLQMNPAATQEQKIAEATRIWDSIDNRFGEMVHDNIFWNKAFKQSMMLMQRSYSWNLGTGREILGGAKDIFHNPAERIAGTKDISARTAYILGLPVGVGVLNAFYQALKTGDYPESVDDLVHGRTLGGGRTGGIVPGVSVPSLKPFGRSSQAQVPEQGTMPGYQKDVFGWYEDWQSELYNKMATLPRTIYEVGRNRDWKNDPILNPESTIPEWLKQYGDYAEKTFGPISVRTLAGGQKIGSNIGPVESMLGVRPAPGYIQDPRGYAEARRRRNLETWKRKTAIEKKQQRQTQPYGGSLEGQ